MWQRHQGALRLLPMFQTYTKYVLYDQIFPPIAMQLAFALMWGDAPDPDDDEGVIDFLLEMGVGTAAYQFAGIPLVSSVFSPFDAMQTPAATGAGLVQRALRTVWDCLENLDERHTEKMLWSLFHLGSYATRVPVSQVAHRYRKGMKQLEEGEGTAINLFIPEPKK